MPMCLKTFDLPTLRGYGISEREKYSASLFLSTTTLTLLGLFISSASVNSVATVAICKFLSATNSPISSSIKAGSINGSSPWTFTITSTSGNFSATSARRSVPVLWSARVIIARPEFFSTACKILSSSVATITSATDFARLARSQTRQIIGLPQISLSGLPGKRVDEYRAGITQIDFISIPPLFCPNIPVAAKFFKA